MTGLTAARARGRRIGRPRKLGSDLARWLRRLVRQPGMTVVRAARRVGVSRATAFPALALPQESMLSACGEIKNTGWCLDKICYQGGFVITPSPERYVFKIKRGGAGDSQKLLTPAMISALTKGDEIPSAERPAGIQNESA